MEEMIIACVLFAIALLAFVLSIRSFCGKGFLLNNAYLYASKQQRESMDKTPYYRQSGVVFLLIGVIFVLNGLSVLWEIAWLSYVAMAGVILTLVYAVTSSAAIEKKKK